jgi:AraC-like DNA-binding protein
MAIPAFRFDTDDYPAENRVELWRDIVAVTHDSVPLEPGPAHSDYNIWNLGRMAVSSGSYWAQTFTRSLEAIRRDQIDHIGLFVQGRGSRYSRIGDTELHLTQYDIQITDFAQTETSFATSGSSGTLYIHRDLAEEFLPTIASFHGQILRDSTANVVAHHILNLGTHLPTMPESTIPHITQATIELALACIQSLQSGSWDMSKPVTLAMRRRVENYIETQLGRPDLTPASIAQACDLSRSSLYRLFDQHDGIMAYVKRRRLHRIRAILRANDDPRSLAGICQDHGFQSSAHFSREFRREFGYSPSDIRGILPAASPAPASPGLILHALHS